MASASLSKDLGELVMCSICCEQYQDPRVLPCQHTYCKRCLINCLKKQSTRKKTITCPECRAIVQIQSIDLLKVNFHMNSLTSVLAKATTTTKMVSLCEKHKEAQKLFCETCGELICCECTIVDHKGHQFGYLEEILKNPPVECLTEKISKADTKKKKVEGVLRRVQIMKDRAKKNMEYIERGIDDSINKQIQILEEKRISLKQKATEMTATENKILTIQHDDLVKHFKDLEDAIASTKIVIGTGDKSEFDSMTIIQAICKLSKLTAMPVNENVVCDVSGQEKRVKLEMRKYGITLFEVTDKS